METIDVLIVDDDANIRQLYTDAFEIAGLSTLTADNGTAAIELALTHHPRVILMDILMPDMDGNATVKKLREDAWGKDAKIIYLTNLSEPENVVKAFDNEPEEYIIKAHAEVKDVVNQARIAMNKER